MSMLYNACGVKVTFRGHRKREWKTTPDARSRRHELALSGARPPGPQQASLGLFSQPA